MSERRPRGELEAQVLRVLWESDRALTAREVQAALPGPTPAHTTTLTALDRLRAKGDVTRFDGDTLRFGATRGEDEHVGRALLRRLEDSSDPVAALLHFAGNLGEAEIDALRRAVERPDGPGESG